MTLSPTPEKSQSTLGSRLPLSMRIALATCFSLSVLAPLSALAGPGGTRIGVTKSARVEVRETERYRWEIEKKARPDQSTVVLNPGENVTIPYTITVRKFGPEMSEEIGPITGEICLSNLGDVRTKGLVVRDQVEVNDGSGWLPAMPSRRLVVGGQLDAFETRCFSYNLNDFPVDLDNQYRNTVTALIDNFQGYEGTQHGVSATADLEVDRSRTVVDPSVQLQDLFECPAGFSCTLNETLPTTLTESIEIPVTITIMNETIPCGSRYEFINTAILILGDERGSLSSSATVVITTGTCDGDPGCVRTQGFWGSSPQGQALLATLVNPSMALGTPTYTSSELLQILGVPVSGNALVSLAHQLIAAKLNILAGASAAPIAAQIALADSLIGSLGVPPIGSDSVPSSSALGQQMDAVKTLLDEYNNGRGGVDHCEDRSSRTPIKRPHA